MTDAGWESAWRALAEKELAGAPVASLSPPRDDGLVIDPVSTADASREEGLAKALGARALVVVTDRAADVPLAAGCEGLWWRSAERAPADHPVLVREPRASSPGHAPPREDGVTLLTHAHEHGASATTQIAIAVVAALEPSEQEVVRVAVAVGPELFVEIAKLRALRRLVGRALASTGAAERSVWIAARSADRHAARLDVATNAIRATLACTAAMIGGADVIGVLPMDATPRGARLARNTGVILARESHLLAVDDAARGSFAIETLTDRMAREAWARAREIAAAGPSRAREWIERDAAARRAAIAEGRRPIVGVTKFALASETCADPGPDDPRDAAPLEAARSRGAR